MEYRKVSLDNLSRLSEMFKLCLNRDVDESYFLWKYKNNPSGEVVAFEAVEGDVIAAFYGVIPEIYLINGREYIVYQSMDTMTHPNFQKRGLFIKLAQMTYDYLIEKQGNVYIVGVPGGNSFHGFVNKLHWKNITNFKYIFLPKIVSQFSNLFTSSKVPYKFIYATPNDPELDSFWEQLDTSKDFKIKPRINNSIFHWKIWEHPYKQFKVVKILSNKLLEAVCIFSIDEKGYLKIEQIACMKNINKSLMVSLSNFMFKSHPQAKFIYTWQPTNTELRNAYKKSFFLINNFNKGLFSYSIPFITYSNQPYLFDKNWFDINDFDIQPLLQD